MDVELAPVPTAAFLEERRRLGHDRHDELWGGVLHMNGLLSLTSVPVRIGHAEAAGHPNGVLRVVLPDGSHHDIDPDD